LTFAGGRRRQDRHVAQTREPAVLAAWNGLALQRRYARYAGEWAVLRAGLPACRSDATPLSANQSGGARCGIGVFRSLWPAHQTGGGL